MTVSHLRNRTLPDLLTVEETDPIVMYFIVRDDKLTSLSSTQVLTAAAASLSKVLQDETSVPAVEAWLQGRIRKVVKRARNKAWDDAVNSHEGVQISSVNGNTVAAFPPMPASEASPALQKLQVTGLRYEDDLKDSVAADRDTLVITLRGDLHMSLGKQVAQASHIVQLFLMQTSDSAVQAWLDSGEKVAFQVHETLDEESADVVVQDAGFTEVPAGSVTASGFLVR